jgi:hypothetical protein
VEAEETLLEQRLRDGAVREVRARLEPSLGEASGRGPTRAAAARAPVEPARATPAPAEEPASGPGRGPAALVIYGDY